MSRSFLKTEKYMRGNGLVFVCQESCRSVSVCWPLCPSIYLFDRQSCICPTISLSLGVSVCTSVCQVSSVLLQLVFLLEKSPRSAMSLLTLSPSGLSFVDSKLRLTMQSPTLVSSRLHCQSNCRRLKMHKLPRHALSVCIYTGSDGNTIA